MRLPLAGALLLVAGVAQAGTGKADCALPGGADGMAVGDGLQVAYRFEPAPRVGQPFAMVLAVCGQGNELVPRLVDVDAVMPAHRHGMNYRPTVAPAGGGAYRAEGFLLHMPGAWEFRFDLDGKSGRTRLRAPFDLEMIRTVLVGLLAFAAPAAADGPVTFTEDERAMVLAHGPWPPAAERDPSNRVSGDPRAVALGETLFFDAALSADGTVACATCHRPEAAFADGRATGRGLQDLTRNTPSLVNARWQRWYGWDGGADSLWAAAVRPIIAAPEMGGDPARVKARILSDRDLRAAFTALFGDPEPQDAEDVMVAAAKAIAAYQETLVSPPTPFDRFRDALAAGRDDPAYPAAARRGLKLFVGRGRCSLCHFGPLFSNGEFADAAVPYFIPSGVDKGRYGGIQILRANPFNLLGRHNDDPTGDAAFHTRHLRLEHRNFGEFKVPSLRGVASTAPYMHDGSLATLADVVRHYSDLDMERLHADGEAILRPLHLTEGEIADLVAFLETLSAE